MRISSGPSRIKEKPRSASSSCGEETPRSSRMPSILPVRLRSPTYSASCEKDHVRWKSGGHRWFARRQSPAGRDRWPASVLPHPAGEDQARVTTAAKSTINIDTVWTNIEAVDGFIQKYRSMFIIFHHFYKDKSCRRSDSSPVADCSASISSLTR